MPEDNKTQDNPRQWTAPVYDAGDGSGDAVIPLPDELLETMGWKEGDELSVSVTEDGNIELRAMADQPNGIAAAFANVAAKAGDGFSVLRCRLKENAPKAADKVKSVAKDTKDRAGEAVTHTIPYMRARDAWYDTKGRREIAVQGYAGSDCWNLGDSELRHFAELLTVMSCETYTDAPAEWIEGLHEHALVLSGYNAAANEVDLLWLDEGFYNLKGNKKFPKPVMERIPEHLREKVLESWQWIGENILSEKFIAPDGYDAFRVPPEHTDYEGGYMQSYDADWLVTERPADIVSRKATRRLERKHSKTGVSRADIADAPSVELERISALLYLMARKSFGHPDKYLESDEQLQKRGEYWNEHQAISVSLMGNPSVIEHEVTYRASEDTIGIKKNKDIGDYAAWVEDLTDAASIFSKYACWLAPDGLKAALTAAQVPADDINRLEELHRDQFERAWTWVGKMLPTLWA